MLCWIFYDLIVTFYSSAPEPAHTNLKVASSSSSSNHLIVYKTLADVLLNFMFNCHSSCCFLLLSFFHSIFSKTMPKLRFMNEVEFKIYFWYSIITFVIYPIVQFSAFNITSLDFIVAPQLIYGGEMVISATLFVWIIFRLNKINNMKNPLLDLIRALLITLIVLNLIIGFSLNIINLGLLVGQINYVNEGLNYTYVYYSTVYPTTTIAGCLQQTLQKLPNLFVDNLTSIFSASFTPLCLTITLLLNVGALVDMFDMKRPRDSTREMPSSSRIVSTPKMPSNAVSEEDRVEV